MPISTVGRLIASQRGVSGNSLRAIEPDTSWSNADVHSDFSGLPGSDVLVGDDLWRWNRLHDRKTMSRDLTTGGRPQNRRSGSDGKDRLVGLDGDDHLLGLGGDDMLVGGFGRDTALYIGPRSTYSFQTHGGNLYVAAQGNYTGEGRDTLIGIEVLSFLDGETVSLTSPIVLDLDGDGVELLSAAEADAAFDMDGDGRADDTSWIGRKDGFLFLDRDGNGTVSDAGELSFVEDMVDARSDLDGLRAFDSDRNGRIALGDARFADFRIWQDGDGDGSVDAGEVRTLGQAGVASISLQGTAVTGTTAIGSAVTLNTGSYARTDGTTRAFSDVALSYFGAGRTGLAPLFETQRFAGKQGKYVLGVAEGVISVLRYNGPTGGFATDASSKIAFANGTVGLLSTLVLDLDGDGDFTRSMRKAKVRFDMDGDGTADRTGWADRGDGFLVVDRDRDGRITGDELSLLAGAGDAATSLAALAAFDRNGDRMVDIKDARFADLAVWRDRNGNGATDPGELMTLTERGITAIGVGRRGGNDNFGVGQNVTLATGAFRRADGTSGRMVDVALAFTPTPASSRMEGQLAAMRRVRDGAGWGVEHGIFPSFLDAGDAAEGTVAESPGIVPAADPATYPRSSSDSLPFGRQRFEMPFADALSPDFVGRMKQEIASFGVTHALDDRYGIAPRDGFDAIF